MTVVPFLTFFGVSSLAWAGSGPMEHLPPDVNFRLEGAGGTVTRIEGSDILSAVPETAKRSEKDPVGAAIDFVSAYRSFFRLAEPSEELRVLAVKSDDLGFRHVKLSQVFRGLEVVPGEILFHFNRNGALYLVTGSYIPTPLISELKPVLGQAAAIDRAAAALSTHASNWPAVLKIWSSPAGHGFLAYEVSATVAADQAWRVFVDARSGKILDRVSTIYTSSATGSVQPPHIP